MLKLIVLMSLFFLSLSILILNIFVLPYVWTFFSGFQTNQYNESINIFFEAQITEYLNFYILTYYINVSIGQVFVFFLLLLNFIENKIKFINNTRKIFYSIFLIFATIITPPDIISQIIISLCFSLIYEIIVLIILLKTIIFKDL
jgi:sec-independent protein translocase protein TatC